MNERRAEMETRAGNAEIVNILSVQQKAGSVQEWAVLTRVYFLALCDQGFDEREALALTLRFSGSGGENGNW